MQQKTGEIHRLNLGVFYILFYKQKQNKLEIHPKCIYILC